MNSDYRQTQKPLPGFQIQERQYSLVLKLQNNDLLITILNSDTQNFFKAIIDMRYIQTDPSFKNIFERPVDILDYIKNHSKKVAVEEGAIRLVYQLTPQNSREIIIRVPKRVMEASEMVDLRISKMKKQFEYSLIQLSCEKDEKINILLKRIEESEGKIILLEKRLEEQRKNNNSPVEVPRERQERYVPRERQRQREDRYPPQESRYRQREQQHPPREQRYRQREQRQTRREQRYPTPPQAPPTREQPTIVSKLGDHPENPHKQYFQTAQKEGFLKVVHVGSGWQSFINAQEIQKGQRFKYSLKIKKLTQNQLCIGFGSRAAFGNKKGSNPECVFYLCNGYIFFGSEQKKEVKVKAVEGDKLKLECDLVRFVITWWKQNNKIETIDIPKDLKNKNLFLMALLKQNDCEIEISRDE